MTQKPFTPNQAAKVEKMAEAASAVYKAIKAIEAAKEKAENWADWETLEHHRNQLADFLSSDNGAAGFEPFLETESGKVFPRRKNPILKARKAARQ